MKKWFILIGILVVLFIGGYFVLSFYTVKFIQPHLHKVIGPGLTLVEIKVKPTYLSARGIRYEDPHSKQRFLQIEEVRIYPSLFSLLKRSLRIREFKLIRPSFLFYRSREGVFVGPWVPMKKEGEEEGKSVEEEERKGESISIQIDRVRIQKGSIDFEDRKVGEPPAQIRLRDLDFEIRGIQYPLASYHSPVELKGKMKGRKQESSIYANGWIDLKTMDLETFLKIRELEVETFKPYYRKRVSAEIDSGTMDMESKITMKGKSIDATGELDFINLHIKEGGGTIFWIPAETLALLLEQKKYQIKVPFCVKGNLGNPQFNLQEAFLTRIAFSLMEVLGLPVKSMGESIPGDTGKETEGSKSIEDLFKKKKEKKR
jgi:hypothetical protein